MGSLIAGVLAALGLPPGLAGADAPYVPSTPVEIGTPGHHHVVAEAGSWQGLIVMLALVLVVGAAVLLYAVRQRTRLLRRRRVRRMGEAAAGLAATAGPEGPGRADRTGDAHHTRQARPVGPERVT